MVATAEPMEVIFQGVGTTAGAEIVGGTLASFLVRGRDHAKEVGVVLNDPAAEHLAGLLGEEDTPALRERLAAIAGQLWIERQIAAGRHVEAATVLAKARLDPELAAKVVAAAKAAAG